MLSCRPDFWREQQNAVALEVTVAGERIKDIKAGIIDDEWFGLIVNSLAIPSPHPLPSTAPEKKHKLWVSAQRFCLDENGLLWLHGNLEKKQTEKNARVKKKDDKEVLITVRTKEKEEDGKAEKQEERNAEKKAQLCIPKTMQCRIRHLAHDIPAGWHFGADQTYIRIINHNCSKKIRSNTRHYVAGCNVCHQTNHQSGKHMRLLQPLRIAKGHR